MKIVAIGAHPDDYELGAGMRLLYHVKKQDDVVGIICSYGDKAGDVETRLEEAIKAAEFIGMKDLIVLNFIDTQFPNVDVIKNRIEELISNINPAIVYSHFPRDRHQDHRAIAEATAIACRRVPTILNYLSPSTDVNYFQPHLFHIGTRDDLLKKRALLRIYKSQMQRDKGISLKQTMVDSRFFGSVINRYSDTVIYAEPFCANHLILNSEQLI